MTTPVNDKFLRPYNPKETEDDLYRRWNDSGFFNPDTCVEKGVTNADAEPFSIVLPPPNVTGTLHMGHAAMLAIEDALVRFERMRGKRTLWLPGTDHAAIATQSKVEKELLKKEKKSRNDLGREAFLARVEKFARESHDTIVSQVKRMGSSVDWSREAFTLDETRIRAVYTAFTRMYDDGLIYRKNRIVNWDPKGQTTVSDDEVVHEERQAALYTFRYFPDFPIAISTTRPETKVGDTAVAVHPDDTRYAAYVGKTFTGTFAGVNLSIRVIADTSVDREFGTGALGVTPAHSQADWDIAERHGIAERPQVINEYAKMTALAGPLVEGKKVVEARATIVAWLKENGLLEKEEAVAQNISTAERTGGIIEPLPKLQWWVDTEKPFVFKDSKIDGIASGSTVTLKQLMKHVVESGQIDILPDRFTKTYYHWVDNLRPWCISRQIWYGHRIPVWYRSADAHGKPGDTYVGTEAPEGDGWEQDPDTLDTWFSSGLWTFSTLGWPDDTADFRTYHPTSILETGYDILFFWVARMILMSGYLVGDIPFRKVYLHGLVRDEKGRKMSKSLGNIIDPVDMIEKYGADATRLSLLMGAAPGNDVKLSEDRVRGYKNFANKLWNIARFVLESGGAPLPVSTEADRALVEEARGVAREVTRHIESFRLDLAADAAYHYVWDRFAAVVIEESKSVVRGTDTAARNSRLGALYEILAVSLKILHPFMPFVTEAIWEHLPATPAHAGQAGASSSKERGFLMVERWPSCASRPVSDNV